jgi:hypothetical protein
MRAGFIYPIKMDGLMDENKKEISITNGLNGSISCSYWMYVN